MAVTKSSRTFCRVNNLRDGNTHLVLNDFKNNLSRCNNGGYIKKNVFFS